MVEKLMLFGVGYVMGTRAGRQRFEELAAMARGLSARPEVAVALHVVRGFAEQRLTGVVERLAA